MTKPSSPFSTDRDTPRRIGIWSGPTWKERVKSVSRSIDAAKTRSDSDRQGRASAWLRDQMREGPRYPAPQ
jgi:hypothetical protein